MVFGVEILVQIQKPRLTPQLFYFKQAFSNLEVTLRKRVLYSLNIQSLISIKSYGAYHCKH